MAWRFWRKKTKNRGPRRKPRLAPVPDFVEDTEMVRLEARNIIHRSVYLAMAAGVLPFPLIDIVALTGIQLRMIKQLAALYEFPYRKRLARSAIISLLTGASGIGVGGVLAYSLSKSVPVVGSALGSVSAPLLSGMLTYAVGRTFAMHFGIGGTLLDFNPDLMRTYFQEEFRTSGAVVTEMEPTPADAAKPAA